MTDHGVAAGYSEVIRVVLEPNLALGEPPLSLLDTDAGAEEARDVLASIACGGQRSIPA